MELFNQKDKFLSRMMNFATRNVNFMDNSLTYNTKIYFEKKFHSNEKVAYVQKGGNFKQQRSVFNIEDEFSSKKHLILNQKFISYIFSLKNY